VVLSFAAHAGRICRMLMLGGNLAGITRNGLDRITNHVQSLEYGEANRMALVMLGFRLVFWDCVRSESSRVDAWASSETGHIDRANRKGSQRGCSFLCAEVDMEVSAASPSCSVHPGGKSTLLDCLAGTHSGLTRAHWQRGDTLFDSARGIDFPPQERHIAYVFQTLAVCFPIWSVGRKRLHGLLHLAGAGAR